MACYLLDTNVALRFLDSTDAANPLTLAAVAELIRRGDQPVITPQVLIELWAVATRSLEDIGQIYPAWLRLVINAGVQGKQVHDVRLAAVVLAHGHAHLVTFNVADFQRYPGIIPVHPQDLTLPTSG